MSNALGTSFPLRPILGVLHRGHLTQEEGEKEALAVKISKKFALLEEERHTVKEEEDTVKRIKGEALKEKDNPGAFIFPIREEMKKIDKGITMINHTQVEAIGKLSNVLCQVGGFLYTMGSILNTSDRLFSTFDRVCYQTFRAARFDVLRTTESDCDDEEEYVIKRNREIDDMLRIRLHEAGSNEEIFTYVALIKAFNINELIYVELCHEFYSTYKFDEVCAGGGLRSDEHFNAQGYWLSISREEQLDLSRSHTSTIRNLINKMITYGWCQRTTGYDKIQMNDLWLLSVFDAKHQNGYADVAWDLYDMMEIRQEAIEHMEYRQSYHWDRTKSDEKD
nr:hypothetical protein [Tanacetum cinerariifolium]